jgi:hypothetical protein
MDETPKREETLKRVVDELAVAATPSTSRPSTAGWRRSEAASGSPPKS